MADEQTLRQTFTALVQCADDTVRYKALTHLIDRLITSVSGGAPINTAEALNETRDILRAP